MDKELSIYTASKREAIEKSLKEYMGRTCPAPSLIEAMAYSVFSPCKRLRPIMAIASCEACGGTQDNAMPFACALELIHTYSLIHDDLPSMDNDDVRRGKESNHRRFGEALAILAGDALLTMAFSIASEPCSLNAKKQTEIINHLADASGYRGMVAGQALDIEGENKKLSLDELRSIHLHKTGRLIQCAILVGALAANARDDELKHLADYGAEIGLAFQIGDDILDFTNRIPGKNQGGDVRNSKSTFATILGVDRSGRLMNEALDRAELALGFLGERGRMLKKLSDYIRSRV